MSLVVSRILDGRFPRMAFFIGRDREARRAYGFDEIALVPGDMTVNPDEVDTTLQIGHVKLEIPFLASAMDGVVDAEFAIAMGKLGGLAVLNLEGVQTRYDNPADVIERMRADPVALNQQLGAYTNFVNLLGWCALAVPAAVSPSGRPLGVTSTSSSSVSPTT